jgi:hypothetical protein
LITNHSYSQVWFARYVYLIEINHYVTRFVHPEFCNFVKVLEVLYVFTRIGTGIIQTILNEIEF